MKFGGQTQTISKLQHKVIRAPALQLHFPRPSWYSWCQQQRVPCTGASTGVLMSADYISLFLLVACLPCGCSLVGAGMPSPGFAPGTHPTSIRPPLSLHQSSQILLSCQAPRHCLQVHANSGPGLPLCRVDDHRMALATNEVAQQEPQKQRKGWEPSAQEGPDCMAGQRQTRGPRRSSQAS